MSATVYDITWVYGSSLDRPSFQHMNDAVTPMVPLPLPEYVVHAAIEDSRGRRVLSLSSASGGGITFDDTISLGVFNATAEKMASGGLVQGRTYSYDLWAVSPDGAIKTQLLRGAFAVTAATSEI